ncbi:MFS general substrate transporter [Paraphysoderma sedebokerense]|nr:MFS general substrate transporter [Paraphysoderma sedebokerense]
MSKLRRGDTDVSLSEKFIPSDASNSSKRRYSSSDGTDDNPQLKTGRNGKQEYFLGFLPKKDSSNIILLVLLYLLQGVPFGLAFGTLPFLLKSKLSYSDMAVFSFSGYPYSLKLLWSPIVDSLYLNHILLRKSWIIPIQLTTGMLFYWLGNHIEGVMQAEEVDIYSLTAIFFTVIFLCATQDIAVDGWALTLLSKENVRFASTSQTVGINTGYFLSFTVFLALNSPEFCNKYLRSVPSELGLLQLGPYLRFWALLYLGLTVWLMLFKKEVNRIEPDELVGVKSVYATITNICKLPHMQTFIAVLLLAKIGFICNEAVTGLKLLEMGFGKQDLALAVLIDFPFQILFGYYAAQWSSGERPLKPWLYAFYGRLFFALFGMFVVYSYPSGGVTTSYFFLVIGSTVLSSFMSTVQFVSLGAFFSLIADPVIGGTYMTLLNTFSNFGGTWPRYFVLEAVDYFTVATCSVKGPNDEVQSCINEHQKNVCKQKGGVCTVYRDGYYIVGFMSVIMGLLLLLQFVKPQIRKLEVLSPRMWKVRKMGTQ